MDAVKRILMRAKLLEYAKRFELTGYDSAEHLLSMGTKDFEVLQQKCGMLDGHAHHPEGVLINQ